MEKRVKVQPNKCLSHVKKAQDNGHKKKHNHRTEQRRDVKITGTLPKNKNGSNVQYSRQRNIVQRRLPHCDETQSADDLELYSVYAQGSKKQNLNHLLNFHYAPREEPSITSLYNKRTKKSNIYSKYDKNQFLQANFQFVVKSEIEYNTFLKSSDVLSHWETIEHIIMVMHENPICPICLYPPSACRITKCGHYFCFPCILHYLSLSDKSWHKCPICTEAITVKDLKSVLIKAVKYRNTSDEVQFDLVKKKCNTAIVTRSECTNEHFPHLFGDGLIYSKVIIANVSEVLQIIERDRQELICELSNIESESIFIEQAIDLLDKKEQDTSLFFSNLGTTAGFMKDDTDYIYFYQLMDGQNMFLHPINCKMLETMYGDIKDCPLRVSGYVLQKEHKVINEKNLKRYKYLQHLPIGSSVEICEIQFYDPTVPEEIVNIFADDIKIREMRRKRKEFEESYRFKKINDLNEKIMGFKIEDSETSLNLESFEQFPNAIQCHTDSQQKSATDTSFAKVVSSKSKNLVSPVENKIKSTESLSEFRNEHNVIDNEIGFAIFDAIEKSESSHNISKSKKKGSKKGTVLLATGLTFGKGK